MCWLWVAIKAAMSFHISRVITKPDRDPCVFKIKYRMSPIKSETMLDHLLTVQLKQHPEITKVEMTDGNDWSLGRLLTFIFLINPYATCFSDWWFSLKHPEIGEKYQSQIWGEVDICKFAKPNRDVEVCMSYCLRIVFFKCVQSILHPAWCNQRMIGTFSQFLLEMQLIWFIWLNVFIHLSKLYNYFHLLSTLLKFNKHIKTDIFTFNLQATIVWLFPTAQRTNLQRRPLSDVLVQQKAVDLLPSAPTELHDLADHGLLVHVGLTLQRQCKSSLYW